MAATRADVDSAQVGRVESVVACGDPAFTWTPEGDAAVVGRTRSNGCQTDSL